MARLVGLPKWSSLMKEIKDRPAGIRIGQYVWNKYGQRGVDGEAIPDLFYADDRKSIVILQRYCVD